MEPDGPLMRSAESLMLSISNEHGSPYGFQQNVTAPVYFPLSASSVHKSGRRSRAGVSNDSCQFLGQLC